jgi:hypothetical protein
VVELQASDKATDHKHSDILDAQQVLECMVQQTLVEEFLVRPWVPKRKVLMQF